MKFQNLREYCLRKKSVNEDFPFDNETLTFKIHNKMFLSVNMRQWHEGDQRVNLKCDPQRALLLREKYASVKPGYHMNKKHWNTVTIGEGELDDHEIFELVDHSYDLVVAQLPAYLRKKVDQ